MRDIRDGEMHVVRIGGREIGIFRWGDKHYAVRNICPHQQAPLCLGALSPRLTPGASVHEPALDPSAPVVQCPWHGWEFSVDSGVALCDPTIRVRTYPVYVRGDSVFIDLARKKPTA